MSSHTSTVTTARRRFIATSTAIGASAWSPTGLAKTADYPSRAIEFLVPFLAGGGTDLVARTVAQGIGQQLKQPVVVLNKGGAAGSIGMQYAARCAPDGYTIALGSTGTHTVNQSLYENIGYDPIKDFDPVSMICYYNNVLVVHPSFPAHTLAAFIHLIQQNPGKYFYGITQNGSSAHLAMELLKTTAGLDLPGVPYRGAAAAVADFLGGQYPILMDVIINQHQLIQSSKSRPLAVTSAERAKALPDIPTVAESGFPGYQAIGWNGLFVPTGTPAEIIQILNDALRRALQQPAMEPLTQRGLELHASTPEALSQFVISESEKWRNLIRNAEIKAA